MSYFLLIDTALQNASVALAREAEVIAFRGNEQQQDHASWLHPAIKSMLEETEIGISQLNGVGVVAGPGSYTGLRVGMAAAKGICYAQKIPLISVSTLQLLAAAVQEHAQDVIISLIDARREEVYAGVYDRDLNSLMPEQPMILGPESFQKWRIKNQILFTGNCHSKLERHLGIKIFHLTNTNNLIKELASITYKKWGKAENVDLAYYEPVYLKEFYTMPKD